MSISTVIQEQSGSIPEITAIVHDLRNPLSTIHSSAEMIMASGLSESQLRRVACNLYGASLRTEELLQEFLSRYRGTEAGPAPSDLIELVQRALGRIAVVAKSQSVQLFRNTPEKLVIVLDRKRIERVLVNLLVNALDVMPDGGTIRISVVPGKRSVLVKIRDTGPGIAPEIRDRLFQPFVTARKVTGLGLGLAVSRETILDHGGDIWVESSGNGACFAFSLPRMS